MKKLSSSPFFVDQSIYDWCRSKLFVTFCDNWAIMDKIQKKLNDIHMKIKKESLNSGVEFLAMKNNLLLQYITKQVSYHLSQKVSIELTKCNNRDVRMIE